MNSKVIELLDEKHHASKRNRLLKSIISTSKLRKKNKELMEISRIVSLNENRSNEGRIFLGVTEIEEGGKEAVIQQATKSILKFLLIFDLPEWKIELVYRQDKDYFFARKLAQKLLNINGGLSFVEYPVEIKKGDIFFFLGPRNFNLEEIDFFKFHRDKGLKIFFMVYKLIPNPEGKGYPKKKFEDWLDKNMIELSKGFICNSGHMAEELEKYIKIKNITNKEIRISNLGPNFESNPFLLGLAGEEPQFDATKTNPLKDGMRNIFNFILDNKREASLCPDRE